MGPENNQIATRGYYQGEPGEFDTCVIQSSVHGSFYETCFFPDDQLVPSTVVNRSRNTSGHLLTFHIESLAKFNGYNSHNAQNHNGSEGLKMNIPVPTPAAIEPKPRAATLTAVDRCDDCGAQAYVSTELATGTLLWCAHHYRKNELALMPITLVLIDETWRLDEVAKLDVSA